MRMLPAPLLGTLTLALACTQAYMAVPSPGHGLRLPLRAAMTADTQPQLITITGAGADPQVVTVTAGTGVQWWNRDDRAHTVTADDGSFTLSMNDGDKSSVLTLTTGDYPYRIDNVSNVTGTIIVQDTPASPTPSSTAGASLSATPIASDTATSSATSSPTSTSTAEDTATSTDTSTVEPTLTLSAAATATPSTMAPSATPAASTATPSPLPSCGPSPDTVPVTITDGGFDPQTVTVTAAMCVQWTNEKATSVTVFGARTDAAYPFAVGPIGPGDSGSYRFDQPGSYSYALQGYSGYAGSVVVLSPLPSPTPTPLPSATPGTTALPTVVPSASDTPPETATPSASDTPPGTPVTTATPTTGDMPARDTPTAAATSSPTIAVVGTATSTLAASGSATPGLTATASATPARTPTAMATVTSAATATGTSAPAPTATMPVATATATLAPTATGTLPPDTVPVTIAETAFDPQTVTVAGGTYVQWTNLQSAAVTVVGTGNSFAVGPIAPQASARQLFRQPGTYSYALQGHGGMTGTIIVLAPPSPSPTSPGNTAPSTATAVPSAVASGAPPTATATPRNTASPPPANTPSASPSPTATATVSPTASPMASPTALPTLSATATPALAETPLPTSAPPEPETPTPTATDTPPPTAAPTPVDTPAPADTPDAGLAVPPSSMASATTGTPTTGGLLPRPTATWRLTRAPTATATPRGKSSARHPARPPGHTIHPPQAITVHLAATGYVRHGWARVNLVLVVTLQGGRLRGRLRLHDPTARLTLTPTRFTRLRLSGHGVQVDGTLRTGRRVVPFSVDVERTRRATTLALAVPARHYHLAGPFHGRLVLQVSRSNHREPR